MPSLLFRNPRWCRLFLFTHSLKQAGIEVVDMSVEAWLSVFQPDSLAVMPKEFAPEMVKRSCGNFICNDRNFVQFEIHVGLRRRVEQRRDHGLGVGIGQCGV